MHNQVQGWFLYYFCLIFDFLVPNAGAVAVLIDDLAFVIYGATQAINDFVGGHAVVCNQISAKDIQQVIQSIVHHFYLPPKFCLGISLNRLYYTSYIRICQQLFYKIL